MATKIKGEDIVLSVHDGTIYRPVACLTSNSLNITRGVIETQTKCEPGETIRAAGSMSYEIPCEGILIDTTSLGAEITQASHDYLMTVIQSTAGTLTWRMDTGLTDTPYYYGTGILVGLEQTNPAGDEFTTFSATISGSGAIVTVSPA